MSWIDILILVIVSIVVAGIIGYLLWRRLTGRGEDCAQAPLTGQDLVRKYHKAYGKKKGGCHCGACQAKEEE